MRDSPIVRSARRALFALTLLAAVPPAHAQTQTAPAQTTPTQTTPTQTAPLQAPATQLAPPPLSPVRPPPGAARPDLIVEAASVKYSGVCKPYNVWAIATVTVRNIGTAASPSRTDVGMVQVVDARDVTLSGGYRGQGVGLSSLTPGESRTVTIGVAYPVGELGNGGKVVSYFARVNFGGWIDESNTANNRLATRITFTPRAGDCPGDPPSLPDLIVESARVTYSGVCKPGSVWANASVTVRNIGGGASAARSDVGMVQVVDYRDIDRPSGYRGQGVGLTALGPGQAATVNIPVSYPVGESGYGGKPVSYFARVNIGRWFQEASYDNNRLADRITFVPSAADCP